MKDPEFTDEIMRRMAIAINHLLKDIYGKKGFCLLVFDFHAPGISNYISNANRKDMIMALRETADRLENNEDIPATLPGVQ